MLRKKRTLLFILVLLVAACAETPALAQSDTSCFTGREITFPSQLQPNFLCDYVLNLGTYTALDEDAALAKIETLVGQWPPNGGCSCATKRLPNGELIFGRNMDLNLTPNPAYIFKTSTGRYKTLNLEYYYGYGPAYEQLVKEQRIDKEFLDFLPYLSTDVFNEKGFYMACNMRDDEAGRFSCSGTHPGGKRVFEMCLGQYVASRCATVKEALRLIRRLDIYSGHSDNDETNWVLVWTLGDAKGHRALVEFANNEISVIEEIDCHTNFFITPRWREQSRYSSGIGRYDYLKARLDSVRSEPQMQQLMQQLYFSQINRMAASDTSCARYDIRSEFARMFSVDGSRDNCSTAWLLTDSNRAVVDSLMSGLGHYFLGMSPAERRSSYSCWCTAFHVVANCTRKTFTVRFFENESDTYTFAW